MPQGALDQIPYMYALHIDRTYIYIHMYKKLCYVIYTMCVYILYIYGLGLVVFEGVQEL